MTSYFITGVSSGIGRGMVCELVRRGSRVWGIARRTQQLEVLGNEIGSDRFFFSTCDVAKHEDVRTVVADMNRAKFHPDVVILNAGINPERMGTPFSIDQFEEVVRTNLFGALVWVDVFLPTFLSQRRGQFAAISSSAAYRGDARWVAYCASKASLSRAFEALRGRYTSEGVRFTTVHLGAVETGMGALSHSPFRLTEKQAVRRILAAVERRASSVTIPRVLRAMVELMRVFPDPLFSRLVVGAFTPPLDGAVKPVSTIESLRDEEER